MITIEVDLPDKITINNFYSKHWAEKGRITEDFHKAVWDVVREQKIKKIPDEEYPLSITMTFYFKGKLLDWINCAAMAKSLEDSLRYCEILKDDSPKFIKWGKIIPEKSKKKYHYVKIEINKAKGTDDNL